jgi:RNase P subunit RPR2
MRNQETTKTNYVPKATTTTQIGQVIRLPIKRIFCSECRKLVRGLAQGTGDSTQVSCPKCHKRLWFRGNVAWRSLGKVSENSR